MSVKLLSPVADSYITDKIVNNKFKAIDSEVSLAGTLDLFVLHAENSYISGSTRITGSNENSRVLIKFDLDPLKALTGSILNLANMSCSLRMQNVFGGQTLPPAPFTIEAYLMSRSWNVGGVGRDIVQFSDIGAPNWISSSTDPNGNAVLWASPGAAASGFVGTTSNIDWFSGSMLTGPLTSSQTFTNGNEDMDLDITRLVSASLSYPDLIPDAGFIIKFPTGSESGNNTLFVKRFISMESTSPRLRPKIYARFPDAIQDNHSNFHFNISGTLFLYNNHLGQPANIISSSATGHTQLTGLNSLKVRIESGSFVKTINASQHRYGNSLPFITGVYSASFALGEWESTPLRNEIKSAGSASFDETWLFSDNSTYHSASQKLVIYAVQPSTFNKSSQTLIFSISNMRATYSTSETPRIRIESFLADDDTVKASKVPLKRKSLIFTKLYYQVRDAYSNDILIPFDTDQTNEIEATLCSIDSEGMYFDAHWMSDLDIGRVYQIDLMLKENGASQIFDRIDSKFRVVS